MNLLARLPLRILLFILIGGFAILIGAASFFNTAPFLLSNVERLAVERMTAKLTETQGVIELLLRTKNLDGAKSVIASFGAESGLEAMFVANAQDVIIASTAFSELSRAWGETAHPLSKEYLRRVDQTGSVLIEVKEDADRISGYVPICTAGSQGGLRPDQCGFLYLRKNITDEKETALDALLRQTLQNALGLLLFGASLWFLFDRLITRRAAHLVKTAGAFAAGDEAVRARLNGGDELAQIANAMDQTLDTVVRDQATLRLRNQAIEHS